MQPQFDSSEQAMLDEIGRRLRARGWAAHVTVVRLLQDWQQLGESVDQYASTIDDYTNDLTGRDALEIVVAECHEPLRARVRALIEKADTEFLVRTQEDVGQTLARYFRIRDSAGWWWKRRPVAGPLAEYLSRTT